LWKAHFQLVQLITKAIITGFVLSIMIGPVFFILLETSIKKGVRAAIAFDIGVLLSDALYILIALNFYFEVQNLTEGENQHILKIIGGSLFIIYGVVTFFKKAKDSKKDSKGNIVKDSNDYKILFLKGFLLNIANPMVIFYWFSVMTLAEKTEGDSTVPVLFFLGIILLTFFSFDLLKIIGAKQLRPLMTDKLLRALNQLIGIVFALFGVFLLIQGFLGRM
jgi:threonine/homoserine/homoserine lactone efflux protein